ncbi:MAG TPA: uroporphyrinogen-III synthase [Candidatus Binatia bacterium]|jgi:uroporphyrinogen III methyltransferase/synthase
MTQSVKSHSPVALDEPLAGKRIVVTRARAQARGLVQQIEDFGGEVIEFPTIEIQPPESFVAFDAAVAKIENYDWLMFTSVNAVGPFLSRLQHVGKTVDMLEHLDVGAIGPETANELAAAGITCCLVPDRFQAEGILDKVTPETMRGKQVLIPRAAAAREVLPDTLRQRGASVDVVVAYRTVVPATEIEPLAKRLRQSEVDVITFTSSSTVKNFVRIFDGKNLTEIANGSIIACIGPITAQTVEQLGGHTAIVAEEFTIDGLVRAIVSHFEKVS